MRTAPTTFKLVLEPDLHAKLKICAFQRGRTLSDEIIGRLVESLALGLRGDPPPERTAPMEGGTTEGVGLPVGISRAELAQAVAAIDKLRTLLGDDAPATGGGARPTPTPARKKPKG